MAAHPALAARLGREDAESDPEAMMSFISAVQACFANYANFGGRARRSEYWFFTLFLSITSLIAAMLDGAVTSAVHASEHLGIFIVILGLVVFLPNLAVTVRRLHDTNRSGWWLFISFVPVIGGIVLLVWMCTRGTDGPNRFGPDPIQPMQPGQAGAVA